jgi:uncharacterized protein
LQKELLKRVEQAERYLAELGFNAVRVRCFPHGAALVEVDDLEGALAQRTEIVRGLREMGFLFVSLDLEGFASGRMNRLIKDR